MKSKILSVALCLTLAACASTTAIRTTDKDARIYVDGEYRGQGAIYETNSKIVGTTSHVRIEKDGCVPVTAAISRSEELDVGALVGGIFVLVPFLWIMKYKPDHVFEFRCQPVR